ncbi:C45 family autoproteolytic acyltransferase/hydolase [Anaerovirgula multivorans]|nr:C45 family peptidase [Anaerovirgula multivorans]
MYKLFDEFCPGINEEIAGFADELNIPTIQVLYYAMSYLRPGCSQMTVLPSKTKNGHTLLGRNYDFDDKMEEMTFSTTRIKGKYARIGSSIMQFGRGDGMNEHGLAVSQTSAGLPVGNFEFAVKPAIVGLQFWAVIRSVLENCKDVDEAIQWTKQMPIAIILTCW